LREEIIGLEANKWEAQWLTLRRLIVPLQGLIYSDFPRFTLVFVVYVYVILKYYQDYVKGLRIFPVNVVYFFRCPIFVAEKGNKLRIKEK
jgi:hypothetical protein